MYKFIKKLEIVGFKSFPDKTIIEFKDGLNAIVGPNGCGKSNIIDALSWVLGETRIKNLRAQKSDDVIFAGTSSRKASYTAQVSVIIDNSKNILNTNTKEVTVKRILTRDGESHYSINKMDCRLKDIQKLFLDTGVGRHSYSIMQQGRIDQIVMSHAQDRRLLLEEAAGIGRSRVLIRESQQKLKRTQQNLDRLHDILKEVSEQRNRLQQQSTKAKRYTELTKNIEAKEKNIFSLRYQNLQYKKNQLSTVHQKQEEKKNALILEMQAIKNSIQLAKESDSINIEETDTFTAKIQDASLKIAKIEQKSEFLKQEHHQLKDTIIKLSDKKNTLLESQQKATNLIKAIENSDDGFQQAKIMKESVHKKSMESMEQLNKSISVYQKEVQDLKQQILNTESKINQLLLKEKQMLEEIMESANLNQSDIDAKITHIENYISSINDVLNTLSDEMDKLISNSKSLKEKELKEYIISSYQNKNTVLIKSLNDYNSLYHKEAFQIIHTLQGQNTLLQKQETNEEHPILQEEILRLKEVFFQKEKELELLTRQKEEESTAYQNFLLNWDKKAEEFMDSEIRFEKLKEEIKFYEEQSQSLTQEIEEYTYKKDYLETEMFEIIENLDVFEEEKKTASEKLLKLKEKQEKARLDVKNFENDYLLKEKDLADLMQNLNQDYLSEKEIEIEENMLVKEFFNRYRIPLKEESEKYNFNLDVSNPQSMAQELLSIQSTIQKDKSTLEKIGAVNLLAIHEFEQISERYEFLMTNETDILKMKQDIEQLIQDSYHKAREDFLQIFHQVNEHLREIFFKAFGGGECFLKLTNEDDPLESGVEIIAKPPGKKMQNLSLFSGGEKTMIALTLMFALFMVKPSPFCIMDEVDAALDEMNIQRFLAILEQFYDKVQFLIISHNRLTAQKANIFYGVTMQELGISKVFSFFPDNK